MKGCQNELVLSRTLLEKTRTMYKDTPFGDTMSMSLSI